MAATVFEGFRVADLTHGFGGPLATMILADNGADVTRVVAPGTSRYRGDPAGGAGGSVQWPGQASDRSRSQDGTAVGAASGALLDGSDILIESFRLGVLDRLRLGYDDLEPENPSLVYCFLTGLGRSRPWWDTPGYEGIVAARAGKMADFGRMFGYERPAVVAPPIAGFAACQALLRGLCAALIVREHTGLGQRVASMIRGFGPHDIVDTTTKHAQVACAEWLAMAYGSRGIRVSSFCPRWMWTDMTERAVTGGVPPWLELAQQGGVTAERAAEIVIDGMEEERFIITTGEDTLRDFRQKANDFDSWIRQLQGWHDQLQPDVGADLV